MEIEIWKEIYGFDLYKISSLVKRIIMQQYLMKMS